MGSSLGLGVVAFRIELKSPAKGLQHQVAQLHISVIVSSRLRPRQWYSQCSGCSSRVMALSLRFSHAFAGELEAVRVVHEGDRGRRRRRLVAERDRVPLFGKGSCLTSRSRPVIFLGKGLRC